MEKKRNAGRKGCEGKREGELKGPRYASVGVGPDWTRVSTFLRRSKHEMWEHEGKGQSEKAETEREANEKRGNRIRETLGRRGERV